MPYTPKIITPDEVRAFLSPFLSYDTIDDMSLLLKIEAVETYLAEVWYEGSYPSKARIPALLLTAAKVMKEPAIQGEHYREVEKIGDIKFDTRARKEDPYHLALTWEEMAYAILRSENHGNIFKIEKVE